MYLYSMNIERELLFFNDNVNYNELNLNKCEKGIFLIKKVTGKVNQKMISIN